ncbi:MAG TPA: hypothetical protein VFZ78_08415, partial [Flavisolibacter sp.]
AAVLFGWSFFATIADRPGLAGNIYEHYQFTKFQHLAYTLLVVVVSVVFIALLAGSYSGYIRWPLRKVLLAAAVFLLLVVTYELYLITQFVPKG